jgi:hypothetical protein
MNFEAHLILNGAIRLPIRDLCLINEDDNVVILNEDWDQDEESRELAQVILVAARRGGYWLVGTMQGTGVWHHYLAPGQTANDAVTHALTLMNQHTTDPEAMAVHGEFSVFIEVTAAELSDPYALDPDPEPPVESTRKVRVEIARSDQEYREFILDFPVVSDMDEDEIRRAAWETAKAFARDTGWRMGEWEKGKLLRVVKGDHPDFFEITEDEVLPEEAGE